MTYDISVIFSSARDEGIGCVGSIGRDHGIYLQS